MPQSRQTRREGDPLQNDLARNVEIEDNIDRLPDFKGDLVERVRLLDRAREPVEDVAARVCVGSLQTDYGRSRS